MNLKDITACLLVKNESYFIGHVLTPLLSSLGSVLVFDTGSEDGTPEIAEKMGAVVVRKGESNAEQIGGYRTEMNAMVETPWTMIVDGDELYPTNIFQDIAAFDVPPGKIVGFTPMFSVDWAEGHYQLIDDLFSRLAIHPRGTRYQGEYPFESPVTFADPGNFFYIPTQRFGYHLHRLIRSPLDDRVFLRKDKQYLYCLQDKVLPILGPIDLPLNPDLPDPYLFLGS